jgi:hypothetical protein
VFHVISVCVVLNFLQGKLDDALEEIVTKLSDKYSPGLCTRHPELPCFHHRASDLHFKLDRPRLLVWAQAIKSGTATYEKIPILSPMFKASLALKHPSKGAIPDINPATAAATQLSIPNFAPAAPSTPFPTLSMPFMPPFMGYGAPGVPYPFGNPFFGGGADPNMFGAGPSMFGAGPSTVSMQTKSPPSSPPTGVRCTIAEFCEKYDLGERVEAGLDKLGFRFGDDLNSVKPDEYTEAGFRLLEWRRVLAAYRKLKHED